MTTAMQIGETARDRADFCRCFKTGAAVFLHDDRIVAHSTYRNTLRAAYMPARTNCGTRGYMSATTAPKGAGVGTLHPDCRPFPGNPVPLRYPSPRPARRQG